jgi:hypothetical protein
MNGPTNKNFFKKLPPQAPLVSQISDNEDDEEDELERVIRQQRLHMPEVGNELQQLQSYLMQRNTTFIANTTHEDERFQIDSEVVDRIESRIGYPRALIVQSVEQLEMNDAATCYYLLDKAKQ